MNYLALATDYDGTIAHDGVVDDATVAALKKLRDSGRKLIMVTGRELPELYTVFDHCKMFDRIVAENGALLHNPQNNSSTTLSPKPSKEFIAILKEKGVPYSVGNSIVATVEPHEHVVLDAIKQLGLEWHVIFNKGSVMALPSGVNKATGLKVALEELQLRPQQVVAIGDAENDHAFMRFCHASVAVANALDSVKKDADWTTEGKRGFGVQQLIERMLNNDLADLKPKQRTHDKSKAV